MRAASIILKILFILILSGCKPSANVRFSADRRSSATAPADSTAHSDTNEYDICEGDFDVIDGEIEQGESFGSLMEDLGLDQSEQDAAIAAASGIFDVTKLQAGAEYHAYFTLPRESSDSSAVAGNDTTNLAYWIYDKDRMNTVIFSFIDSTSVKVLTREVSIEPQFANVTISNSLWYDTQQAGVPPLLALKLSEIYAWSIDFFALQKGDSFRVLYDLVTCGGDTVDVGDVRYCDFFHDGKHFESFRYVEPQDSTGNSYWDQEGRSLRKAFLKAPLKFSRISSGFTYHRVHPIYHTVRAHTGVDYAAPKGTPVMSIGDGKVISRGWGGGGGNTVKIRHNSAYSTAYMHLSRFGKGIAPGVHVHQGQVIGYVGSTGASTGPHLDFRVWKNGTPVNPLKMESPPTDPVRESNMTAFVSVRDSLRSAFIREETLKAYRENILRPFN